MFYFFIGKTIPKSNLRFAAPQKQAVTKQNSRPSITENRESDTKPKSIHSSFLIQEISKAQSNQPIIKKHSVGNLLNAIKGRIATDHPSFFGL